MVTELRQRLMGMPLDAVSFKRAIARIEAGLAAGRGGAVLTPNLDILRQFQRSTAVREAMERIELLVPDGVPLVWASRLQGTPVPARITGTDMLWGTTGLAARRQLTLFIAGGRPDQGPRAAERLRYLHPTLRVDAQPCFVRPGPLEQQISELARVLEETAPALVLVALPFAAQLGLIATMRPRLPGTWFIGIGSSCDFINGDRPRAPRWLQRAGLEWAHRVAHEPRMARRYLVDGLPFAAQLGAHVLRVRLRRTTDRRRPAVHDESG
jgi:N-acetylglucosaminyldiphosphoundecaprenol N-acetyl-beta-D-mannosaminyltransferase